MQPRCLATEKKEDGVVKTTASVTRELEKTLPRSSTMSSNRRGFMLRALQSASIFAIVTITTLMLPNRADAQPGQDSIKPGAKGVVGGALVGAELVVSVESIVGLHKNWHYALGAGLGAVGGGVGGYFVGKQSTPAGTSLLVGGIFFAIPATVLMLNGMSYEPPTQQDDLNQAQWQLQPLAPPTGLIGYEQGSWDWKVPAIEISQLSTREEQLMYGAKQGPLVDVSLVQLRF